MKLNQLLCRIRGSHFAALCCAGIGAALRAADAAAAPFAAPIAQPDPGSAGGLVRVTVALIIVLAAVLAAAWFARRMRGLTTGNSPNLQILAQLSLGARERAVLLRVGEHEVLIGVAPGNVRTLHVMSSPVGTAHVPAPEPLTSEPQRPTFKSVLLKSLGK